MRPHDRRRRRERRLLKSSVRLLRKTARERLEAERLGVRVLDPLYVSVVEIQEMRLRR